VNGEEEKTGRTLFRDSRFHGYQAL